MSPSPIVSAWSALGQQQTLKPFGIDVRSALHIGSPFRKWTRLLWAKSGHLKMTTDRLRGVAHTEFNTMPTKEYDYVDKPLLSAATAAY